MPIVFPSNTREIINEIRGAIGREVEFIYVASSTPCSACSLDPITDTSTDSFCEVCSGNYWIPQYSGVLVSGHIIWGKADFPNWQSAGIVYDGDCTVQIELTSGNLFLADNSIKVIVDDKVLEIKRKTLRGVQSLNRIILSLIESENDDG